MTSACAPSASGTIWAFASEFYARPGIGPALLRLQDEAGLDVLAILTLLHAGRRGLTFGTETLADLLAQAHHWQVAMILPLRKIRRLLAWPAEGFADGPREALRTQIKAAELAAERLVLERLEQLLPAAGDEEPGAAIRANLGAYLTALPERLGADHESALAGLALAAV